MNAGTAGRVDTITLGHFIWEISYECRLQAEGPDTITTWPLYGDPHYRNAGYSLKGDNSTFGPISLIWGSLYECRLAARRVDKPLATYA
ncbi:hypothetical protein AVEN_231756-1 [Araneus ventricosus]|uniref:Uncharacterized protein n=1 Tax=Araneus ventricosus TaxID=182803 RepID=A0A4Y2SPX3_ARAVE|nr:hypothetical protein AVEN_231756-1 [Araneus ventricosus]